MAKLISGRPPHGGRGLRIEERWDYGKEKE